MLDPDRIFRLASEEDIEPYKQAIEDFDAWAVDNGFRYETKFVYQPAQEDSPIVASGWWSEKDRTWGLIYCAPSEQVFDFTTLYTDNIGVTTGSNEDAMFYPDVANAYKQAFTGISLDDLYEKHLFAREIVERRHHMEAPREKRDLVDEIKCSILSQAKYITAISFWRVKGWYWYFIRRPLLSNKSIS